jgi:hypothetical protein
MYLTRQRPIVTLHTTRIENTNSTFSSQSLCRCFLWISEQRAIISVHSINSLILSTFVKLGKVAIRLVVSVLSHETTRFPLEGFS